MGIFDENTKTGQDFERILVDGSAEELNELKAWLFKENIRLETERNELKRLEEKFLKEKLRRIHPHLLLSIGFMRLLSGIKIYFFLLELFSFRIKLYKTVFQDVHFFVKKHLILF